MDRIDKPWGYEEIIEVNDKYVVKRLVMKHKQACSLQYHEYKRETVFVFRGSLHVELNDPYIPENSRAIMLFPGDSITISPGVIHRMSTPDEYCEYIESSTTELDDVVRIKDNYGRV